MENVLAIYRIFAELPGDYAASLSYLKEALPDLYCAEYAARFSDSEMVTFPVNGFEYVFDMSNSAFDTYPDREPRIVCAYGHSLHTEEERDKSRMQGFVGAFSKIEGYKGFDKGHFISHKIGGCLDHNLYPQESSFNRGISKQGKLYRGLERYCEENLNAFVFTRPIYNDETWVPQFIDYGIFTTEQGLLFNRFQNRP